MRHVSFQGPQGEKINLRLVYDYSECRSARAPTPSMRLTAFSRGSSIIRCVCRRMSPWCTVCCDWDINHTNNSFGTLKVECVRQATHLGPILSSRSSRWK